MSVNKQGIITSPNIYESKGTNILLNVEKYTETNPFILSGTRHDIFKATDMYCRVNPGKVYYLSCQTDSTWASGHPGNKGEAVIWLYLVKTFDPSNTSYDLPICFTSPNWVEKGVWKYTIPEGYNMARVRFNTYSTDNNEDVVTCKFWNVSLIPKEYYISPSGGVLLSTSGKTISRQEKLSKSKSSKGGDLE